MEVNLEHIENIKHCIEQEIRQLKLKLYEKQFELSEIRNIIRKNCVHDWQQTDIEMGHSSFSETKCNKCDATINNNFDRLSDVLLT